MNEHSEPVGQFRYSDVSSRYTPRPTDALAAPVGRHAGPMMLIAGSDPRGGRTHQPISSRLLEAAAFFGSVSVSTPSLYCAEAAASSMSLASENERLTAPE